MSETEAASTKTIMGVGIASLIRLPTNHLQHGNSEPIPACDASVSVAGEIDCAPHAAAPSPAQSRAADPVRSTQPLFPPAPKRRWWFGVLVVIGVLALPVVLGIVVRSAIGPRAPQSEERARTAASEVAASSTVAAPDESLARTSVAPVHAAYVATPATSDAGSRTPARVSLGNGSCSVIMESSTPARGTVDDQAVGLTPVEVSGLWCGRRIAMQLQRTGFATWNATIVPQEGRTSRIMASLRRPPPPVAAARMQLAPSSEQAPLCHRLGDECGP